MRISVLAVLYQYGPMTSEELADRIGVTHLQVMKRVSDLRNLNRVKDTGERKPTKSGRRQIVWDLNFTPARSLP